MTAGWVSFGVNAAAGAPDYASIFGANLKLWITADYPYITESSNAVSGWADKSSPAYNLSQGSASNKPTWVATGWNGAKGVVRSDRGAGSSTRKWLANDGSALADILDGDGSPWGIIIVGQCVSQANLDTFACWGFTSDVDLLNVGFENASTQIGGTVQSNGTDGVAFTSSTNSDTNRHVYCYTGDTTVDAWVDGTQAISAFDIASVGSLTCDRFTIGALRFSSVSNGSNFDFREVIVVNKRITADELTAARTFAAAFNGGLVTP